MKEKITERRTALMASLAERQSRLQALQVEIENVKQDIQAISGAVQDCDYWAGVVSNEANAEAAALALNTPKEA